MEVVYIDVLILTNFIFHLIALYLTAQLTGSPFHLLSCFLSAFLGALVGAWLLIWCQSTFLLIATGMLTLGIMTYATYKPRKPGAFLRIFVTVTVILFLCGTLTFYFLSLLIGHFGVSDAATSDGKVLLFAIISGACGVILALSGHLWKKQTEKREVAVTVEITDKKISFPCITDTGCTVKDPMGGKYVLFMPMEKGEKIFSENDLKIITSQETKDIGSLSESLRKRVRLVPCQTIMGGKLLVCILADRTIIDGSEKQALLAVRTDTDKGMGICPASLL